GRQHVETERGHDPGRERAVLRPNRQGRDPEQPRPGQDRRREHAAAGTRSDRSSADRESQAGPGVEGGEEQQPVALARKLAHEDEKADELDGRSREGQQHAPHSVSLGEPHRAKATTSLLAAVRRPAYSLSIGSSNSTPSLTLPCPSCGKPDAFGLPGSRFDAVSSGGNSTSVSRNSRTAIRPPAPSPAKASRAAWASPPWRRITSVRLRLRPSWP